MIQSNILVGTNQLTVVVEKPFTVNATDADHLIKVQKDTGKTLTVFQSMFAFYP